MDIVTIGIAGTVLACAVVADLAVRAFSVTAAAVVRIGARIERAIRASNHAVLANTIRAVDVLAARDIATAAMVSVRARIDRRSRAFGGNAGLADAGFAVGAQITLDVASAAVVVVAADIGINAVAVGRCDGRNASAVLADAVFAGDIASAAVHRIVGGIDFDAVTNRGPCLTDAGNAGQSFAACVAAFAAVEGIGGRIDTTRRVAIRAARLARIAALANPGFGVADRIAVAGNILCTAVIIIVGITLSAVQIIAGITSRCHTGGGIAGESGAVRDCYITSRTVAAAIFGGVRFTSTAKQMAGTVAC